MCNIIYIVIKIHQKLNCFFRKYERIDHGGDQKKTSDLQL